MICVENFLSALPTDLERKVRSSLCEKKGVKEELEGKVDDQWKRAYESLCDCQGGGRLSLQGSHQNTLEKMLQASKKQETWHTPADIVSGVQENPNLLEQPNLKGELPLHMWVKESVLSSTENVERCPVSEIFQSSLAWNHQDLQGQTPVHLLGKYGKEEALVKGGAPRCFEELKQVTWDPHLRDVNGKNPLHHFAHPVFQNPYGLGWERQAQSQLEEFLECVPQKLWGELFLDEDAKGFTPLGLAFSNEDRPEAAALLKAGADPRRLSSDKERGVGEKERRLEADVIAKLEAISDLSDFNTAFHFSLYKEELSPCSEEVKLLLRRRVEQTSAEEINQKGSWRVDESTLAVLAGVVGDPIALHQLKAKGADFALRRPSEFTPLFAAVAGGHKEAAFLLMSWGAILEDAERGESLERVLISTCHSTEILEALIPNLNDPELSLERHDERGLDESKEFRHALLGALMKVAPQQSQKELEKTLERLRFLIHESFSTGNTCSFQWLMRKICPLPPPRKKPIARED